jgi:hypothetical protein
MRAYLSPLCLAWTAVVSACAGPDALRAHADRGAPIVPRHLGAPLEPASELALLNPLTCGEMYGSGKCDFVCGFMIAGCAVAFGVVDLVALPVQAVRRNSQWHKIEQISAACPVADPSSPAASGLSRKMVEDFHFSPPPADPAVTPPGAVILEVRTDRFTRSTRISWEGRVTFRGPDDAVLWSGSCRAEAPARHAETFERECEAARAEVAALADPCIQEVSRRLHEEWKQRPTSSTSVETRAGAVH